MEQTGIPCSCLILTASGCTSVVHLCGFVSLVTSRHLLMHRLHLCRMFSITSRYYVYICIVLNR